MTRKKARTARSGLRRGAGMLVALMAFGMLGPTPTLPVSRATGPAPGPIAGLAARASLPQPGDGPLADYLLTFASPPLGLASAARPEMRHASGADAAPRLDATRPASRDWLAALRREQDAGLAAIPGRIGRLPRLLDRFDHVLNGVTLPLSAEEAEQLQGLPGLRSLHRLSWQTVASDAGPAWSGAPAIWDGSAIDRPEGVLGAGRVIGVIDTGIHAEHPSFGPIDDRGFRHVNPRGGYLGWCDPSHPRHQLLVGRCNAKLIGMWSHERASMGTGDENGHGTHVASIAAGNVMLGAAFGRSLVLERDLSGVAPRASLVSYDACDGTLCMETATLAAIEQAVRDGVDVINYSITVGNASPWESPHDLAFLAARAAGVFVAVAAGNGGPEPASLSSLAPWLASVANSSHDRAFVNRLEGLEGGLTTLEDLEGRGITAGYGPAPILHAEGRVNRQSERDDGRCLAPFPPGSFEGGIVVCRRGENGRVEKGVNVLAGGAGALLLINGPEDGASLSSDLHVLPAVHLTAADGARLEAWLAEGSGHQASIAGSEVRQDEDLGDRLSRSSSRGPAMAEACCRHPELPLPYLAELDLLKPDLAAPGSDILAAQTAGQADRQPEYGLLSGTSMSSPHLAGAAALIVEARPGWSVAQTHAALVGAARPDLRHPDGRPVSLVEGGAGQLDLVAALRAGLLLDETVAGFQAADPAQGGSPAALNLVGLVSADCPGRCSWHRTLESALDRTQRWSARLEGPAELGLRVEPEGFSLESGQQQGITVTAEAAALGLDERAFGAVIFEPEDGASSPLRLPVALRRVGARLPRLVYIEADASAGSETVSGIEAPLAVAPVVRVHGLQRASERRLQIGQAPRNADPFEVITGSQAISLSVAAGTERLVTSVAGSASRDLDLWLGRDDDGDAAPDPEETRCSSVSSLLLERCDLLLPEPGPWWLLLQNRRAAGSLDVVDLEITLLAAGAAGNLSASLSPHVPAGDRPFGGDWRLRLDWDLPPILPGERWLGSLELREPGAGQPLLGRAPIELLGVTERSTPTRTPTGQPSPSPTRTPRASTPAPGGPILLPMLVTRNR